MTTTTTEDYHLSSYEPVRVKLPSFDVRAEDIQAEMQRIALRHAATKKIEDRAVVFGDVVRIDIVTTADGKEFGGLTRAGIDVQLGIGVLPQEVEVALIGKMPGNTIIISYDYSYIQANYADGSGKDHAGKDPAKTCGTTDNDTAYDKLESTVTIHELREFVVPELTDDWVDTHIALLKTVDEFYDATKKRLMRAKKRKFLAEVSHIVMSQLGERFIGKLPEDSVKWLAEQMKKEFERFLGEQQLDLESYLLSQGMSKEKHNELLLADAKERIRQDLALLAYARHFGLTVTDDDINANFLQPTPEKTFAARADANQSGSIGIFKNLSMRAKAAEYATQQGEFVDANGKLDKQFYSDVTQMYANQQAVRAHTTALPTTLKLGAS
ncbi:MAG: hypothetical protein LBG97_04915 [Coriobacteriales bacterium]|jgi:trigger factor|nr:hypothetical protein [Coriobacteriales bacterium]